MYVTCHCIHTVITTHDKITSQHIQPYTTLVRIIHLISIAGTQAL